MDTSITASPGTRMVTVGASSKICLKSFSVGFGVPPVTMLAWGLLETQIFTLGFNLSSSSEEWFGFALLT